MRLTVRVRPGSPRPGVQVRADGSLHVSVRERAVEGRANEAVREALAEHLGVAKSRVGLVSGARSRNKIYEVQGI